VGFDLVSLDFLGHFYLEDESIILSQNVGNPISYDAISPQKNANLKILLNIMLLRKSLNGSFTLFFTLFIDRHLVASTSTDHTRKCQ
jgi:hypothetical protein